jgi:uncharacterized membrane protein
LLLLGARARGVGDPGAAGQRMTVVESPPQTVVVPTRPPPAWATTAASPILLAAALTAVALLIRSVGLVHAFELWVDEMLYADLGASLGRGEMPRLADGPFFLHPPGFFLLEGGVIRLFGIPTGDAMELVYDLRWLTAALGALTVGVAFLLMRRAAGVWLGAWGALVLALEPFVLRINSRVFLETLAQLVLAAGMLVVVRHLQSGPRKPARARHAHGNGRTWPSHLPTLRLFAGGLLLGYAVFTKDAFALFAVVPIVLAVAWRRTLRLREAAVVVAGAVVPYGTYLLVVGLTGYLDQLVRAKLAGVLRLVGTDDFTGFNAPGAPSLVERLIDQVAHYGTTYVLLALCPLAGLVASSSARPERRLLGLVAVVTGAYGVYMVAFGTAEEQYAYPIMFACVCAVAVAIRMALERRPALRVPVVSALAIFLACELVLGARQELARDDTLLAFRSWAAENLPETAKVGATNGASGYAYADDPRFGPWPTADLLATNGAQYVLTFELPTRQGYTLAAPEFLDWLEANAQPVFRTTGPTHGDTVLWFIDQQTLARAAAAGVGPMEPAADPLTGRSPAAGAGGASTGGGG